MTIREKMKAGHLYTDLGEGLMKSGRGAKN
jgi:hypothetical protein